MLWRHFAAILTLALSGATAPTQSSMPALRIFIYDFARLPEGALLGAQLEAVRILHAAGVELQWHDCSPGAPGGNPPACTELLVPSDLVVRIKAQRHWEYRVRPSGVAAPYEILGHALCVAENEGNYIDIYGMAVRRMAAGSEKRLVLLLGYGIAHEIGHLLLGRHTGGIMAADWAEKDVLAVPSHQFLFLGPDSTRLIERARARMAAGAQRRGSGP